MNHTNTNIVHDLRRRGIDLHVVRDVLTGEIRLRATPRKLLTESVVERLRAHRAEIIETLAGCGSHNNPEQYADEPDPRREGWIRTTCRACGRFLGYRPADLDQVQKSDWQANARDDIFAGLGD